MQFIPSLPADFKTRMEDMLGDDYPAFLVSYERPRKNGLRVNTWKISCERFTHIAPFALQPLSWIENGFLYDPADQPAQHPLYRAGLYYLQEPSAMAPASLLPVQPGERVLDLCAAPGGKATELGARLKGRGLLVANDVSAPRAKALLRNLELAGIGNCFVTNESPKRLAAAFPDFFDKILVDAPCSGEGMFRKEPAAVKTWSLEKSESCARMQREILKEAVSMLAPGGLLLYSTCTFAPQENEGSVSYVLETFPEMELLCPGEIPGASPSDPAWGNGDPILTRCLRLWPHRCEGEGHFLALFKKNGTAGIVVQKLPKRKKGSKKDLGKALPISRSDRTLLEKFLLPLIPAMPIPFDWERVEIRAGRAYLLPEGLPPVKGLRFLRNGLFLGELKKDRFEPSQPLALSLTGAAPARLDLPSADPHVDSYLRGESFPVDADRCTATSGWALLCAEGFPLGWGKVVNGVFKNKYPAGWR